VRIRDVRATHKVSHRGLAVGIHANRHADLGHGRIETTMI
jgi:hypothetical protein